MLVPPRSIAMRQAHAAGARAAFSKLRELEIVLLVFDGPGELRHSMPVPLRAEHRQ